MDESRTAVSRGPGLTAGTLPEASASTISSETIGGRCTAGRHSSRRPFGPSCRSESSKKAGPLPTLSFYTEVANAFDDESVNVGLIFATHTGLVWNMMRRDQQFRSALASRDVIGHAKVRMMERLNINDAQAFAMLKLKSQDSNTRIAQVAQRVVTGEVWPSR
jgi:hypothetical protein